MVDTYRDSKRRDIYQALDTDPEGNSCFKPIFYFFAHALSVTLNSASKSTNSLGYCELREPIRAPENEYQLLWYVDKY